jgi:hypothetical protein
MCSRLLELLSSVLGSKPGVKAGEREGLESKVLRDRIWA